MGRPLSFVCILILAVLGRAQDSPEGPCFQFEGDSYIHFTPNNFDNNEDVHYSMKFRTAAQHGVIMYARGRYGDEEALFVRNGKLEYLLFNMSPTGVEGYFGGHYRSEELVNTNEWITVNVYRSWPVFDHGQRRTRNQTGFSIEIGGQSHTYLDYYKRDDLSIMPTIYFGGFRDRLSDTVSYFNGQIKDIREENNHHTFEEPSLNYMSKVGRTCSETFQPEPV